MIVVTGAAGFIGSCLVAKLNEERYYDLVLVDDFTSEVKTPNLSGKKFTTKVPRDEFIPWLDQHHQLVQFIFHLGARTDTAERNTALFDKLNLNYSKAVWESCVKYGLPLVYASSAATYGAGEHGYNDGHEGIPALAPLNPYGESKQAFDCWVLKQEQKPYFWVGLKFFNVFGPNEYHKGRMASVVFHAFREMKENGRVRLFRSHRPDFKDGAQMRDFIYVKDVVNVCFHLMGHRKTSGIFNLGSGKANTFNALVNAVFEAADYPVDIEFIDIPADIRDTYQYFTQAKMEKLRKAGYINGFYRLDEAITDYVRNYLNKGLYY